MAPWPTRTRSPDQSAAAIWVAVGIVGAFGAVFAAVFLQRVRVPPASWAPATPTATASATEPATAPLAPLQPAASSRAPLASAPGTRSGASTGGAKSAFVPVTVSVSRVDSTMTSASALVAFVAPARACFDRAKLKTGIELRFSPTGQLVATNYSRSEADSPLACVQSRIDALKGSTLNGYVGGQASTAELQMGS